MTMTTGPVVAVGAVIVVDPAHIVLIRRGRPPGLGTWTLPGGRVSRGEALSAAARREVLEETGLDVEIVSLIEVIELIGDDHHFVVHDYLARLCGPIEALRAGDDADDARVVAVEDLEQYAVTELVKRVVTRALAAS